MTVSDFEVPAVLFLVFNRPDTTAQVMEAIRQARPTRLYVAADGPRDRAGEQELCDQTRAIATALDWPCEVRTLFREKDLGCGRAVSSAISWFFDQEEEGIILEDDCIPSLSFFRYCEELLERYRHDKRVMCVSGGNYQDGRNVTDYSYYFSRYMHCWGWASWRRAWQLHDPNLALWDKFVATGGLRYWSWGNAAFEEYWNRWVKDACRGVDIWDCQWMASCWMNNGLTCIPQKNLVQNVGFDERATHTTERDHRATLAAEELGFPLLHPPFVTCNVEADIYSDKRVFGIPSANVALPS